MEERNRENVLSPAVYSKLVQHEAALTSYLKLIRRRPELNRTIILLVKNTDTIQKQPFSQEKIKDYLKIVREITCMQKSSARKAIANMIQYIQEFPTLNILVQMINTFGKQPKNICLSESIIMAEACDEMIPVFRKIIQKAQMLEKQAQSRKIIELGQRIVHLQKMVEVASKQHFSDAHNQLTLLLPQRVKKYMDMEENIQLAEKKYGRFSLNLQKIKSCFVTLTKFINK